jgi:chemotaxis protein CheD
MTNVEPDQAIAEKISATLEEQIPESVRVLVGPARLEVSDDPDAVLCTVPLGSGIGLVIYDPVAKVGGVLHSLLPASSLDPDKAITCPAMFLDAGLEILLGRLSQINAKSENIQVFAAGAAQMMGESPEFNIGLSNCDRLPPLLAEHNLTLHAQALGGRTNCSMELNLATGEVWLKYSGAEKLKKLCKP